MEQNISIYRKKLEKDSELIILIGGINADDPKKIINKKISEIVQNNPYSEFIDSHLDNPYIRVIISNINKLNFDE